MDDATRIEGILSYLDLFEAADFSVGTWSGEEGDLPWFSFDEAVSKFIQALYKHNWIIPFDWSEWQHEAEKYVNDPTLLETADVETISKLFTTHVRKDRFCEGHLASMFENGHIVALLRRLKVIHQAMDKKGSND